MVREKREGGPQPGPEGRGDLRRVGRDHGELAVVDLELRLKLREVPDLARALRSPIAPVKRHDERKAVGELGESDGLVAMIR
jgi:hypothetical protein